MAFPTVEGTNTSQESSNTTSHSVSLPASVASGDMLVVFFGLDVFGGSSETVSWPGSWVELFDVTRNDAIVFSAAYLDASGGETTVTVTSTYSDKSDHMSYRISGWHGTTVPESADTTGNDAAPDSPSLSPSWGAADTLWIAAFCADRATESDPATADPTNYGNFIESIGGDSSAPFVRSGRRELNASSEDPGAWTISKSEEWLSCTVAIRPSAAGGANPKGPFGGVVFRGGLGGPFG